MKKRGITISYIVFCVALMLGLSLVQVFSVDYQNTITITADLTPAEATSTFMEAVGTPNTRVILEQTVTLRSESLLDVDKNFKPVMFAENVTVTGEAIFSSGPIQLIGDNVTFTNIRVDFTSTSQQEIFLNGHSLTLDSVSTTINKEPTISAGAYKNTQQNGGTHAEITVSGLVGNLKIDAIMLNNSSNTTWATYSDALTVNLPYNFKVSGGVNTVGASSSAINITGANRASAFTTNFTVDENTTLHLDGVALAGKIIGTLGELSLENGAVYESIAESTSSIYTVREGNNTELRLYNFDSDFYINDYYYNSSSMLVLGKNSCAVINNSHSNSGVATVEIRENSMSVVNPLENHIYISVVNNPTESTFMLSSKHDGYSFVMDASGNYTVKFSGDIEPYPYSGDIDGDGELTQKDYDLAVGYATCRKKLNDAQILAGDLDYDGALDGIDVIILDSYLKDYWW